MLLAAALCVCVCVCVPLVFACLFSPSSFVAQVCKINWFEKCMDRFRGKPIVLLKHKVYDTRLLRDSSETLISMQNSPIGLN